MAKALRILHGEIRTPPMSIEALRETGFLLRELQEGIALSLPSSRPMPEIETGCHELRVDAILILEVFGKGSKKTPKQFKETCRKRVREYRRLVREES